MKHHRATAVVLLNGKRPNRPMGILTETEIAMAAADGKDLDTVQVHELLADPRSAPSRHPCGRRHHDDRRPCCQAFVRRVYR
jgi:hypothetical protein